MFVLTLLAVLFTVSLLLAKRYQRVVKQRHLGAESASRVDIRDLIKIFLGGKDSETWRISGPLYAKYGYTFQVNSGIRTWTFTSDPENIRAMLSTYESHFDLARRPIQFAPVVSPQSVFTAQGGAWRHCRTLLKPQFSRENISHLNMLEEHIPVLFDILRQSDGKPIDVQELLSRYTITTALDFLVGTNIQALEAYRDDTSVSLFSKDIDWNVQYPVESTQGRIRFLQAFAATQRDSYRRAIYYDTYWMLRTKNARVCRDEVHRHIDYFIDEALAADDEKVSRMSAGEKGHVFLYQLINESRDRRFLRDQILSILVAARDTTASLLTWTFFYLARHPDVVVRLKDEIRTTYGTTSDDIAALTFDSLRECRFLRYVLNETMRCAPAVPVNYRGAAKDTTLPVGGGVDGKSPILIEKGQTIYFNTYYLHRRKDIWGEDANQWKPERWETLKTKPWTFIPFGGGPRVCIGQQFALAEASYLVIRLFQEFDSLECMPGAENDSHDHIQFKQMAALFMEGGCELKFR